MKINPRYYPAIIIAAYVIFLLLGILLGFDQNAAAKAMETACCFNSPSQP